MKRIAELATASGRDEALFSKFDEGEAILMYTAPKIIASLDVSVVAAEALGDHGSCVGAL